MKRVLKWQTAVYAGEKWLFRWVSCENCTHWWWEIVQPVRYSTMDSKCACNQGKEWKP